LRTQTESLILLIKINLENRLSADVDDVLGGPDKRLHGPDERGRSVREGIRVSGYNANDADNALL